MSVYIVEIDTDKFEKHLDRLKIKEEDKIKVIGSFMESIKLLKIIKQ